jgi:dihydrofolate reductase
MILSAIAAMAKNRVIGKDNKPPYENLWDIPEDLKFFRASTKGHVMIMGRKTFDSFEGKPLPGRPHIVITRSPDFHFEHPLVKVVRSLDEAVTEAAKLTSKHGDEVFVIGGAEVYRHSLDRLDRIYLTVIDKDYEGDTYFPEVSLSQFKLSEKKDHAGDPSFSFQTYIRI